MPGGSVFNESFVYFSQYNAEELWVELLECNSEVVGPPPGELGHCYTIPHIKRRQLLSFTPETRTVEYKPTSGPKVLDWETSQALADLASRAIQDIITDQHDAYTTRRASTTPQTAWDLVRMLASETTSEDIRKMCQEILKKERSTG